MGDNMGYRLSLLLVIVAAMLVQTEAHGRLIEPPSRASAWRYGFSTPANYDDNQLFCGGKQVRIQGQTPLRYISLSSEVRMRSANF